MTVTYNIGILAAQLRLTAIRTRHGNVIREGLVWQLKAKKREKSYESLEAQPLFQVPGGKYHIEGTLHETYFSVGAINLERNTRTDLVLFIAQNRLPGDYDPDEEFFIKREEMSEFTDTERRKLNRKAQRSYGAASGPLHHFDAKMEHSGELGNTMKNLHAHPLLANKTQFDGVPDDLRLDNPAFNEEGIANTIELTLQKHLANQPGFTPGPKPGM